MLLKLTFLPLAVEEGRTFRVGAWLAPGSASRVRQPIERSLEVAQEYTRPRSTTTITLKEARLPEEARRRHDRTHSNCGRGRFSSFASISPGNSNCGNAGLVVLGSRGYGGRFCIKLAVCLAKD
jgi:hypothetical protein